MNIAISRKPAPASANFWSASTIRNGCTRLSDIFRPPSSRMALHEYQDLPKLARNGGSAPAIPGFNAVAPEWLFSYGAADAAPAIPAAESTLGSHPCVALSSAQVLPEWINCNLAVHGLSANGDNPLTSCLTPRVHFTEKRTFCDVIPSGVLPQSSTYRKRPAPAPPHIRYDPVRE